MKWRAGKNEFGPNRVTVRRGTPAWLKFLQQWNSGYITQGYRLFGEESDGVLKVAIKL